MTGRSGTGDPERRPVVAGFSIGEDRIAERGRDWPEPSASARESEA
jgi:hypothetical protein